MTRRHAEQIQADCLRGKINYVMHCRSENQQSEQVRHQVSLNQLGFTRIPGLVSEVELAALRNYADCVAQSAGSEHEARFYHHGSILPLALGEPVVAQLFAGAVAESFNRLGISGARWLSGYVISKRPGTPQLWWHQDWFAWNDPLTYRAMPAQLSLMIYLSDTNAENGALRVIPGSHRSASALHDALPAAHSEEIEHLSSEHPAFQSQPGEQTIEARAGDVIVCDVRLLHATHANNSDQLRHGLTLWFMPDYESLPSRFKAYYGDHPAQQLDAYGTAVPQAVRAWLPPHTGHILSDDQPVEFQRTPSRATLARLAYEFANVDR